MDGWLAGCSPVVEEVARGPGWPRTRGPEKAEQQVLAETGGAAAFALVVDLALERDAGVAVEHAESAALGGGLLERPRS